MHLVGSIVTTDFTTMHGTEKLKIPDSVHWLVVINFVNLVLLS